MANLQVQELIDAGIHFGHPASRWNPKMAPYIYGRRNFIHIIDLKETVKGLIRAKKFLIRLVAEGKDVIFVGTKRQARAAIEQEAKRCAMPYVSYRWLGGTLTNFRTIRSRMSHLDELDQMVASGAINAHSKKMISHLQREHRKMKRNLDGIRTLERLPGALVVVDPVREKNAVREAKKLNVPVVALADTEADPDDLAVVIPGNDDAMRAIEIILKHVADAVAEGRANRAAIAAREGEGQALTRAPSRPRARGTQRAAEAERPVPEMPLPKPHPALQEGAAESGKAPGEPGKAPGEAPAPGGS
ncbi:MAG: 30S ribosomal protein S2 [Planctomycetes bacterium]|nr:30S ribosomal protein S2 [Planctomycetota bacterium]